MMRCGKHITAQEVYRIALQQVSQLVPGRISLMTRDGKACRLFDNVMTSWNICLVLVQYPTAARYWKELIELELKEG